MSNQGPDGYYTPQEVANLAGGILTAAMVRHFIEQGRLPALARPSPNGKQRQWFVSRVDAIAFVQKAQEPSEPKPDPEPRGRPCVRCGGSTNVASVMQEDEAGFRWRKCVRCGHRRKTVEIEDAEWQAFKAWRDARDHHQ
jgi:hypothetical protein